MIFLAILGFIFGLGLIICIHEFGHFIFAKKAGILCYEFSLGMGPALYRHKKGETTYAIRMIPIGGYVSMAGEEITTELIKVGDHVGLNLKDDLVYEIIMDETEDSLVQGEVSAVDLIDKEGNGLFITLKVGEEEKLYKVSEEASYIQGATPLNRDRKWRSMQIAPYKRSFDSKPLSKRFLSISAGPVMNFLLGIVLCFIVGLSIGKPDYSKTVISEVSGPASEIVNQETKETALMKKDKVISIDGKNVNTWNELSDRLDELVGTDTIQFVVERNGEKKTVNLHPIIYLGNLGICGYSNSDTTNGVQIQLYTTKAKEAGIKNYDYLRTIKYTLNGKEVVTDILSWNQLVKIANGLEVSNVTFVLDRPKVNDDKIVMEDDQVVFEEKGLEKKVPVLSNADLDGIGIEKVSHKVGISPSFKFDFFYALGYGFTGAWGTVVTVFKTLGLLFTSKNVGVSDLSGPVGIFSMVESIVSQGFIPYLSFLAMLSVNVGIMNLLPLPALDGGRLVFIAYEGITRKKPNKKIENIIHTVFLFLLLLLFVYITFNDITRIFG